MRKNADFERAICYMFEFFWDIFDTFNRPSTHFTYSSIQLGLQLVSSVQV